MKDFFFKTKEKVVDQYDEYDIEVHTGFLSVC